MQLEQLMLEPKNPMETIGEYAYRMMRKNIIYTILKPGESISENAVAGALGTSRTPIRETFAKLTADGLLEVFPQRGTYISLIDGRRVKESVFMRVSLEQSILETACAGMSSDWLFQLESSCNQQSFYYKQGKMPEVFELDNQFHELIFTACGMEHVWQAIRSVSADCYRLRYLKLSAGIRVEKTIAEHREIICAIKDGNAKEAKRLMRKHIKRLDKDVDCLYTQYEDYFKK